MQNNLTDVMDNPVVDSPVVDERPPVVGRIEELFSLPLETWNRIDGVSENLGGLKLWMVYNYKNPEKQRSMKVGTPVVFYNEDLLKLIKAVPAQFFTLHRVVFNDEGLPVEVAKQDGTVGHKREQCGFMIFLTVGTTAVHQRWLQEIQDTLGVDYVDSLQNHAKYMLESGTAYERNGNYYLKGVSTRINGIMTPMKLSACIYFAYTSGGQDDSALWGFQNHQGEVVSADSAVPDSVSMPV